MKKRRTRERLQIAIIIDCGKETVNVGGHIYVCVVWVACVYCEADGSQAKRKQKYIYILKKRKEGSAYTLGVSDYQ